jgi:hypothetical protein
VLTNHERTLRRGEQRVTEARLRGVRGKDRERLRPGTTALANMTHRDRTDWLTMQGEPPLELNAIQIWKIRVSRRRLKKGGRSPRGETGPAAAYPVRGRRRRASECTG